MRIGHGRRYPSRCVRLCSQHSVSSIINSSCCNQSPCGASRPPRGSQQPPPRLTSLLSLSPSFCLGQIGGLKVLSSSSRVSPMHKPAPPPTGQSLDAHLQVGMGSSSTFFFKLPSAKIGHVKSNSTPSFFSSFFFSCFPSQGLAAS